MTDIPKNIQEFNAIAGFVFAQLYRSFPIVKDIDRDAIAKLMGARDAGWDQFKLGSGHLLGHMMGHTIGWLNQQAYIQSFGDHPAQRVVLTEKGLVAMNAVPEGLQQSLGAELAQAEGQASSGSYGTIGELIGGFFGGLTKSLGGG